MSVLDIHVRDKRFGARRVLRDVRLTLRAGEVVSLVGASGCGKSTLLRIAAGLDSDYDGDVRLASGATRAVGVVFQEPRLFPWLTTAQNVAFATGAHLGDARALSLLEEVGLAGHEHAWPKQLSGGQAQRVAIARALYTEPRVLLLDEPFSAVDAFTRMKLQDLLADRVAVLGTDARGIVDEITIDRPHPRARRDAELAQARTHVFDALHAAHAI